MLDTTRCLSSSWLRKVKCWHAPCNSWKYLSSNCLFRMTRSGCGLSEAMVTKDSFLLASSILWMLFRNNVRNIYIIDWFFMTTFCFQNIWTWTWAVAMECQQTVEVPSPHHPHLHCPPVEVGLVHPLCLQEPSEATTASSLAPSLNQEVREVNHLKDTEEEEVVEYLPPCPVVSHSLQQTSDTVELSLSCCTIIRFVAFSSKYFSKQCLQK